MNSLSSLNLLTLLFLSLAFVSLILLTVRQDNYVKRYSEEINNQTQKLNLLVERVELIERENIAIKAKLEVHQFQNKLATQTIKKLYKEADREKIQRQQLTIDRIQLEQYQLNSRASIVKISPLPIRRRNFVNLSWISPQIN